MSSKEKPFVFMCLNRGGGPQGLYFPPHLIPIGYRPGGFLQIGHQVNQGFFGIPLAVFQYNEV
jgi:hypothetical protein